MTAREIPLLPEAETVEECISDAKARSDLGRMVGSVFTTLPIAAVIGGRLTLLEIRALAVIGWYDRMSTQRRTGAGCFVSNRKIAELLGCDYTSLSKAIRRLREGGFLVEERGNPHRPSDRRRTTYRVLYPEISWSPHQLTEDEIVGDDANYTRDGVGPAANHSSNIVGVAKSETCGKLAKTASQEISQRDRTYLVETKPTERATKTQIAEDWQPVRFADGTASRQITDTWASHEYARQLEAFSAHHRANASRFVDWQAAWSTWVLRTASFSRSRADSRPRTDQNTEVASPFLRAAIKIANGSNVAIPDVPATPDAVPAIESPLAKLMRAANMTSVPADSGLLRLWLKRGITIDLICAVAARIARRENERGKPVRKLKYLEDAVLEEFEAAEREREYYRETIALYRAGST